LRNEDASPITDSTPTTGVGIGIAVVIGIETDTNSDSNSNPDCHSSVARLFHASQAASRPMRDWFTNALAKGAAHIFDLWAASM
jgi:hypothetical protein